MHWVCTGMSAFHQFVEQSFCVMFYFLVDYNTIQLFEFGSQVMGSSNRTYNIPYASFANICLSLEEHFNLIMNILSYLYRWPSSLDNVMTQMRIFMLDVFQVTSVDCWQVHHIFFIMFVCSCLIIIHNSLSHVLLKQYVSFYTGYMVTVLSLINFVLLAWAVHTFMDRILLWFPEYTSSCKAYRNSIVKFSTLVIGIVYPGIAVMRCAHL